MTTPDKAAPMIGAVIVIALFFMPALIACFKRHRNATAITVLNIFLGWTVIGWLIALIWALARPSVVHVYLPPVGPYRPGIDPPGDDPHRSLGFDEDHSVGARRAGRDGRSISHSYGGEGRNWVD